MSYGHPFAQWDDPTNDTWIYRYSNGKMYSKMDFIMKHLSLSLTESIHRKFPWPTRWNLRQLASRVFLHVRLWMTAYVVCAYFCAASMQDYKL